MLDLRILSAFALCFAFCQFDVSAAPSTDVIIGGGKGYLRVNLDKDSFTADEPIRGYVLFKLESVRDRYGKRYNAVVLNAPKITVALPDQMQAVIPQVIFTSPLQPTIKVGHEYRLRFHVRMDEEFRKLLRKPKGAYAFFNTGSHSLQASIVSSPLVANKISGRSPFTVLTQVFKSPIAHLTIERASVDAPPLTKASIVHAIEQASGSHKKRIIAFYVERNTLATEDLLRYINDASGNNKADLIKLYLSRNLPVDALTDFKAVGGAIHFTGHNTPPVLLKMEPKQQLRMTFKVDGLHRMLIGSTDKLIIADTRIDFTAPASPGLYEMLDPRHKKTWGWILVHRNRAKGPSDKLRPNTKTLSQNVATAIFKQDSATLKGLAAPDFRTSDIIRKMKFKLGSGDIRYHQSTGTKNNVKTRMLVNIADAGEEPVLARELILDFVRIGSDLKLVNATVVDLN